MRKAPKIIEPKPGKLWVDPPWEGKTTPDFWFEKNVCKFLFNEEEILERSIPYNVDNLHYYGGVYFLIHEDKIVYVGQTNCFATRLVQHKNGGKILFSHYWYIPGIPELFVIDIESFYIRYFNPICNNNDCTGGDIIGDVLEKIRYGKIAGFDKTYMWNGD